MTHKQIHARLRRQVGKGLSYLVLTVIAVIFLMPSAFMIVTAFKPRSEIYVLPFQFLPTHWTLQNFIDGWNSMNFTRWFLNSVYVTVMAVAGTLISCTLTAYGFARFNSRWNGALFGIVLAMLMIPKQITLIPTYILFARLGWVNTYAPLIVPYFLAESSFTIFLLRQFFRGIPRELDEAAKIDGANSLRILLQIHLPAIKPALFTAGIMNGTAFWNDFLSPLIYLTDSKKLTVPVGLQYFRESQGTTRIELLVAVALISILPMLALFLFAQRYFIEGVTMTGIKG